MEKRKKILFLIGGLRAGGAEKVCVGLINEFFKQGFDVSLLVLNLNKQELKKYLDTRVPLYNLNINHTRSAFFPLKKILSKLKPDICLSFNFQISVQLIIIKKIFGLNFSLFSRGISTFSQKILNESSFRHRYFNAFLIKKIYKNSDFFIAQSTGMKEDMIQYLNISSNKIKIIFNPLFEIELDKEDSNFKNKDVKEVLFVGSLKQAKNIPFLLKSIKVLSSIRQDFVLKIIGGGELKENLESIVIDLEISDIVYFEGFSTTPSKYYKNADVFVLTSWYEGFPNVLIEALSYGVPLVSVDCMSGPSDIIENDINGYLVKGYDAFDFSNTLSKALDKKWDINKIKGTTKKFAFENIYNRYKKYLLNER